MPGTKDKPYKVWRLGISLVKSSWTQWLRPIIPVIWEAEIGRMVVQADLGINLRS
jgi:hypothetical protein